MSKKDRFKDDYKLSEIRSQYKYKCKCSHTFTIYPMEHLEYKICSYCGRRVYTDPIKQKEWERKESFKAKLKVLL